METAPITPGRSPSRRASPVASSAAVVLVAVNLTLLAGAVWAMAVYGSVGRAVAYHLRGETLFLDSSEKSFGVINRGETTNVTFKMANYGPAPIRILGCRSPCTCLVGSDLPMVIPENGSRDFVLRVHLDPLDGSPETVHFDAELTLFTSNASQSRVPIHVKGEVHDKPSSVGGSP